MNITTNKRLAITRRLSDDTEWAGTELGKVCKLLIDTDAVPFSTLASHLGKSEVVVQRWVNEVDRPGGSKEEQTELDIKLSEFRQAVVKGLEVGDIPVKLTPEELLAVIQKHIPNKS